MHDLEEPLGDAARPLAERVRLWIIHHDDSWLFTGLYVSLAVVRSIWISLFWLVVVVAVHFGFEWVRHREQWDAAPLVAGYALWNVKLDLALVVFALCLTAYMDLMLGLAGLGVATRLGVQSAARTGGWARAFKGILLSLDDAAQVARAGLGRRLDSGADGGDAAPQVERSPAPHPWRAWTRGDGLAILFGVTCGLLILVAPWWTDHDYGTLARALLQDLHPYPLD